MTILWVAALTAAPTRGLIPGKQVSPETVQLRKGEPPPPPKQEPGWGELADGVSVRLRTERTNWSLGHIPAFTLDVQNQGARDFMTFQLQERGSLQMDGIWYEWLGPGVWHPSPLPPGTRFEGIAVMLTPDWYPKQDRSINPQPPSYRPLRLGQGSHTVRFAITCTDANAPDSKTVRRPGEPSHSVTAISNPVKIEVTGSDAPPAPLATAWGSTVEGVSVLLEAEHTAWMVEDSIVMKASVRNEGIQDFTINAAEELGELEMDGAVYQWGGEIDVLSSMFAPGRRYDNIPIRLASPWIAKDRKPLRLSPGRHTVRFAMLAQPKESRRRSQRVRALSNPVQIDLAPGIRERAELITKYLPACSLRAVRRQDAGREIIAEVLSMPGGREMDLATARQEWRGHNDSWENPKLNSILPEWNLKLSNARAAEDTMRIVLGLFRGMYTFADRAFKAEPLNDGWVVTADYIGPAAQVQALRPMELMLQNGVLKAVRERAAGFSK